MVLGILCEIQRIDSAVQLIYTEGGAMATINKFYSNGKSG